MKKNIVFTLCVLALVLSGCGSATSEDAETTTKEMVAFTVEEKTTEAEKTPTVESSATETIASNKKMCNGDAVNIRASASTDGKVVGSMAKGTVIEVLSEEGEFYGFSYNGKTCFVAKQFFADYVEEATTSAQVTTTTGTAGAIKANLADGTHIPLDSSWEFAEFSKINSGTAIYYKATANRKNIVVGVNAGHGTKGGESVKTYCHPDKTEKVTGGTTSEGSIKAIAVSSGMDFDDDTPEKKVTLKEAQILRDLLLADGYDVVMLRDGDDVQLDNVARTVICNNMADCHIALHWDGDGLDYDKGCFYMAVPDGIKDMYPVSEVWQKSNKLGDCLIAGLEETGNKIFDSGSLEEDLTQTSYSKVPSMNIELGNQCSDHDTETLTKLAKGLLAGINKYFAK